MEIEERIGMAIKIIVSTLVSFKLTRREIKLILESVEETIPEDIE